MTFYEFIMIDIIEKKLKVSVCVITYNQGKYIRRCLQSILNQETNFDFEVIVADDCSTDGTRAMVMEFEEKYPKVIRTIFQEKNTGGTKNFLDVHATALGEYVAHMDGDDYALPGKLQIQADYLDKHSDCSVVWHRMNVFDDAGRFCVPNLQDLSMYKDGKVYLQDALMFGSVCYHSSTMYRSQSRKTRFIEGDVLDWFFTVEFLMSGYGKYLEQILGGYRFNNDVGISRQGNIARYRQKVYVLHLKHYLRLFPEYRNEILVNSLLSFLVDVKNYRFSAIYFLKLVWESIGLIGPNVFIKALKRYRHIHPKIL